MIIFIWDLCYLFGRVNFTSFLMCVFFFNFLFFIIFFSLSLSTIVPKCHSLCGLIFFCIELFYGQNFLGNIDSKRWCRCNMPRHYLSVYQYNVSYLQMQICQKKKLQYDRVVVCRIFIFMSKFSPKTHNRNNNKKLLRTPCKPTAIFSRYACSIYVNIFLWVSVLFVWSVNQIFICILTFFSCFICIGRQLIRMLLVLRI